MNDVVLAPADEVIQNLERLYGRFDIGVNGHPTPQWEERNLRDVWLERRLRFYWAPDHWLTKIRVNRRMIEAIQGVLTEINARWDPKAAEKEHLDTFVRCYAFGGGEARTPNAHWWGAAWDLSPRLSGVALEETIKIFTRHGFTWYGGGSDKHLIRHLEYL